MAELRKNPFTNEFTWMFPEARKKPMFFEEQGVLNSADSLDACPFEHTQEEMQEEHILFEPEEGSFATATSWVIRNKYPFASDANYFDGDHGSPLFQRQGAHGASYVLISREHHDAFGLLPEQDIVDMVTLQCRAMLHMKDAHPNIHYIQLFRNVGKMAGASVVHPHAQLVGSEFVPHYVQQYVEGFALHGDCLMCTLLKEEKELDQRVVYENDQVLAFAPFWSTGRAQIWIVPKTHHPDFYTQSSALRRGFANALSKVSQSYYKVFGALEYNEYLYTRPFKEKGMFHWFYVLHPRTVVGAGYEMATRTFGTDYLPEEIPELLDIS